LTKELSDSALIKSFGSITTAPSPTALTNKKLRLKILCWSHWSKSLYIYIQTAVFVDSGAIGKSNAINKTEWHSFYT